MQVVGILHSVVWPAVATKVGCGKAKINMGTSPKILTIANWYKNVWLV